MTYTEKVACAFAERKEPCGVWDHYLNGLCWHDYKGNYYTTAELFAKFKASPDFPKEETQWQPIETAPKDGTEIKV